MLLKSCREGQVDEVRTLLVRGEDVNQKDYWGASSIHCAVDLKPPNDLKMLQVLLSDEHLDLNAQEGLHKRSAAHLCASKGKADCLAALIQAGAEVAPLNSQLETPAHKVRTIMLKRVVFKKKKKKNRTGCSARVFRRVGAACGERDGSVIARSAGAYSDASGVRAGRGGVREVVGGGKVSNERYRSDGQDSFALRGRARARARRVRACRRTSRRLAQRSRRVRRGKVVFGCSNLLTRHTASELASLSGHDDCAAAIAGAGRRRESRQRDASAWSVRECVEWARENGLGETVCAALEAHDVSGDLLLRLDEGVLRDELGVASWGARKKTLAAVTRLGSNAEGAAAVAGAAVARAVVFEELVVGELLGVGNFGEV
jgi:hypothetical protein